MAYLTNTKFYIDASAVKPNLPRAAVLNKNMISLNDIVENIVENTAFAADNSKVFLQTTQPAAGVSTEGDVWINTNSGRVYQYSAGTWTSKYNPTTITENKTYTYSTYNKQENFTSGTYRVTTTTGDVTLSSTSSGTVGLQRTVGNIGYYATLAYNGFFDAAALTVVDGTDPLVVNAVVVSNGGNYITTASDVSANLTQVSTTPTTATIKYEDVATPANSASVYCENTLVYIGGVDTIVSINGDTTAINSSATTMSGATIKLDGAIPTTAKKHTKIVKDANDDTLIDLPLLETTIQVATTSAIAVAHNDTVIEADASGGVITLTLPAASTADAGVKYYIYNLATSVNNVEIDSNGTDYINGNNSTNIVLPSGNGIMLIPISATKWFATTV